MNFILIKALEWVLPVLLGPIVYYVARAVLNTSQRIDDLPAPLKRVVVVMLGGIVTAEFSALKLMAPEACAALSEPAILAVVGSAWRACAANLTQTVPVQGLTAAAVAMLIHLVKKQRPND